MEIPNDSYTTISDLEQLKSLTIEDFTRFKRSPFFTIWMRNMRQSRLELYNRLRDPDIPVESLRCIQGMLDALDLSLKLYADLFRQHRQLNNNAG